MSTLMMAILVILSYGAVLFTVAFLFDRLQAIRPRKLHRRFRALGSSYHLSFTEQDVWGNRIIGLDGHKGQLLFLEEQGARAGWSLVDLSKAKSCRVKKEYGHMPFLRSITLEIELKHPARVVSLPFYTHKSQGVPAKEVPALESKAKKWEAVLVKRMGNKENRA